GDRERHASAVPADVLCEAILNGLSSDPEFFIDTRPARPSSCEADGTAIRDRLMGNKVDLFETFEQYRPSESNYSSFFLFFNFSHNLLKGMVIDVLLWGETCPLMLNDLLSGVCGEISPSAARITLARALMGYARLNPHRIRGRLMPVIVYDPS